MTMGDRVAVMLDGVLQQVDTPQRLYEDPRNVFVAGFMGSPAMNLLAVSVADEGLDVFGPPEEVFQGGSAGLSRDIGQLVLGLRPEDMELVSAGHGLPTRVELVEDLGPNAFVHGTAVVNGQDKPIIARVQDRPPDKGEIVYLASKPGRVHLFSASDGTRIAPSTRAVVRVA
jgi:multiple sugar transport system ATP-binding protein